MFGVRQDTLQYFRFRLKDGRARAAVMFAVRVLEGSFRLLARGSDVTAVGTPAVERYRRHARSVLPMKVTLSQGIRSPRPIDDRSVSRVGLAAAGRPEAAPAQLLTVGRLDPEKNPLLLLKVCRLLIGDPTVPDFNWTWIGDGDFREPLRAGARDLGLAKVVETPGFVVPGEPLAARYAAADLYVHIALTEGLPQVLYEAAAAGLPIIATDVGGVREALANGEAGVLVPPADAAALAGAIAVLLRDPHQRQAWAERAVRELGEVDLKTESRRVADFLVGQS